MTRRKLVNDLRKRNRLTAKLTAAGAGAGNGAGDEFDALTKNDRRAVAAARAVPVAQPVVSRRPLDVPGGWTCGGLYVYPGPVAELRERFLPAERLNFGPLMENLPFFLGKSPADVFEYLLRSQRAATAEPVPTVDVAEFFDGNGDRASVAPNVVGGEGGPSFELLRDTLLRIAKRRDVVAVGVEIGELPNPDHPGDRDMWPTAERVFIWTTEPLKVVRAWVKPLRPDEVARTDAKAIAAPDGKSPPAKAKVYEVFWD